MAGATGSSNETRPMHGEVSEREDLLDGRVRVELEGSAGDWSVAASLGWRRAREGEVALEEGDLTLASGSREIYASIDGGSARHDPETGAVDVRASFIVDGSTGGWLRPGARMSCDFAVGSEEWSGELRIGDG